jgi:hypothetical protein
VYPLGPDSAAYFTDLETAEAQAQGDGLQTFVPLRLVKALCEVLLTHSGVLLLEYHSCAYI